MSGTYSIMGAHKVIHRLEVWVIVTCILIKNPFTSGNRVKLQNKLQVPQ